MPAQPRAAPPVVVVLVAAPAIALNVIAQVLFAVQYRPELGVPIADAVVGALFAVCAVLAGQLSARRLPAMLMLVGSFAWPMEALGLGLDHVTRLWILPWSLQGGIVAVVLWLAFAYPSGRLATGSARALVATGAVLWAVSAVLRATFYNPGAPDGDCYCELNPLAVFSNAPIYAQLLVPLAQWCAILLALASLAVVAALWRHGSAPWRSVHGLVLGALVFALIVVIATSALAIAGAGGTVLEYAQAIAAAAVPVCYVTGLYGLGATRARAADLMLAAREGVDRTRWEGLLREALGDPTLLLDWEGASAGSERDDATQVSFPVASSGESLAVIHHDPVLLERPELLASAAEALRLSVENERLTSALEATLGQVVESRARIVEAGDEARRRIERDLHDGAQQLLVSSAINLRLARAEAAGGGNEALVSALDRASHDLQRALAELRELARGITPAVLVHGGMQAAVEELALRCPVPVAVRVSGDVTLDQRTQATIYFVVAEALANIAKHAGATAAEVEVTLADPVGLRVADDGNGGAAVTSGGGLRGIVDRIEAVGGAVDVHARPGQGTTITATLPASSAVEVGT